MESKKHWELVYSTKATSAVSWFQPHADFSLRLIRESGVPLSANIIDVGAGASTLVDDLLTEGYLNLTVLDLSAAALAAARERLGLSGGKVQWLEANIMDIQLPVHCYDLWHDRALFHFLTAIEDRRSYVQAALRALKPGAHVIVAAFAEDGPNQCSGLPVRRYSASELHAEFGESFTLVKHQKEAHHTPFGTVQQFVYCYFRRVVS
jgi:ubiquinone/menaquinone biosynthesis C-methylase UbiE